MLCDTLVLVRWLLLVLFLFFFASSCLCLSLHLVQLDTCAHRLVYKNELRDTPGMYIYMYVYTHI